MAKKINGLARDEWNRTVRGLAKEIYGNPKAEEKDMRKAMSVVFPTFSDKLQENLLKASQAYVEVQTYFVNNYFLLWCSDKGLNEIAEQIVPLFPDNAWMVKDVQKSVFVKALVMDKIKAMVAENVSVNDVQKYQKNQRDFVSEKAKEITGKFVRRDVFGKFCREINYQMDKIVNQEVERIQTLSVQRKEQEVEAKRKKEEKYKKKVLRRAQNKKRLHEILAGEKIRVEGGKYAFCCTLSDAVLLREGALVYTDGVVYRRGKEQKVEETSLQVKIKQEKTSGEEVSVSLPKNLSIVWVVSESEGNKKTFRVTVVPSEFDESSSAVRERFSVGENFAFEKKGLYEVWQGNTEAPKFYAYCRKATKEEALIAKGEKNPPKRPGVMTEKKSESSGSFGKRCGVTGIVVASA